MSDKFTQHSTPPILQFSRRSAAFTLIEILVVVFIALIASAIAMPSFMRAMEGQRIRTSARIIVTSHKYARNMAVLRQRPMALLLDRKNGTVEIVSLEDRKSVAGMDMFMSARHEGTKVVSEPGEEAVDESEKLTPNISVVESRELEDGVRIDDFTSEGDVAQRDDTYWINYYASGMSDGFELKLTDEKHREAKITSDAISGGVEVDYE